MSRVLALLACLVALGGAAVAHGHPMDVQDADHDGLLNHEDNCPEAFNPKQGDIDGDTQYNAVPPVSPVNPTAAPPETGGDACDIDDDGDTLDDATDNCPRAANQDQVDLDKDGKGNPCDSDDDGDNRVDEEDNCPGNANPDQRDHDRDGLGDACDPDAPKAEPSSRLPGFDPADKTGPVLKLRMPARLSLEGAAYGVPVRVTCSEACVLQGRLGRARSSASLEDSGWTWLFVPLGGDTLRRVRGSGFRKVSVRVRAQDPSGNRTSASRRIRITR
jgi:Thrombospondin type 3 repeat